MNEKHLLINSVILLFRASQLEIPSSEYKGLVREIIADIKLSDFSLGNMGESKTIESLKNTVNSMASELDSHHYSKEELILRLKIDTSDEPELFSALQLGIEPELNEIELKKTCLAIFNSLQTYLKEKRIVEIIKKANYMVAFQRDKITNLRQFVADHRGQLEPFEISDNTVSDPAIISDVNLNHREQILNIFRNVKEMNLEDGILKTGFQGYNRMTRGGLRRGEEIVAPALQHNYKTGLSLTLFKQIALYNKPYMIDKRKKPLIIRISFEDDLTLNMEFLYRSLIENETGKVPDTTNISIEEMTDVVYTKLAVNGYTIRMLRVDPTQWTYRDVINFCLKMEAEGYEIHLLMLDYLKMLPTTGCTQGAMGQDVRDMFRRIRNFCNPRRICLYTPHQLSTEAKMMIRDGKTDFVKELPGKGYYDGCRTIDNEVDLEIFSHIEKSNGKAYLTLQRGKHRINGVTPAEYLYCVLPFQPDGGILDDINGPDTTRSKVGGGPIGTREEKPFWDLEI